jgi:hypothetical protein
MSLKWFNMYGNKYIVITLITLFFIKRLSGAQSARLQKLIKKLK